MLCGAVLFVVWNALLLLYLWGRPPSMHLGEGGGAEPGGGGEWGPGSRTGLAGEVIRIAEEVEVQLETQKKLLEQIEGHRAQWVQWVQHKEVGKRETGGNQPVRPRLAEGAQVQAQPKPSGGPAQNRASDPQPRPDTEVGQRGAEGGVASVAPPPQVEVIPVLVIACDRVTVRRSLDRLIQYRPSSQNHPIIISQDCGHADTARVIGSYGDQVTHLSQPDLSDIRVRPDHRKFQGYYRIARHYRWALNQVFRVFSYSTVVIVEDDLEVGPGSGSGSVL